MTDDRDESDEGGMERIITPLHEAFRKIDEAAGAARPALTGEPRTHLIRSCGRLLTELTDLLVFLYDFDPELAHPATTPGALAVDLDAAVADVTSPDDEVRDAAVEKLASSVPEWLAKEVRGHPRDQSVHERLREWWSAQPRPYVPPPVLRAGLEHHAHYYRWHAARRMGDYFGVSLWDDPRGAPSLAAADTCLAEWNASARRG